MPLSIDYFSPDSQILGDETTSISSINVIGTATADTYVYIYDGDDLVGSALSTSTGAWSFETGVLSDGDHVFSAVILDSASNPIEIADPVKITIVPAITDFTTVNDGYFEIDGLQYQVQSGGESWSITAPDSHTTRFQVSAGDAWEWDSAGRERSEIAGSTRYEAGQTVTVKYDFMVEPGPKNSIVDVPNKWLAIGQFHAIALDGNPPFDIELIGEKLAFNVSYQEAGDKYPSNNNYIFVDDTDIIRGKYYDVKIQTNLQNDKDGFVKVWIDGELAVDYSGPVGYGTACYWKEGIYRTPAPETIAVNFRDLSISEGNGDLIASVTSDPVDGVASGTPPEGSETPAVPPVDTASNDDAGGSAGKTVVGKKGGNTLHGGAGDDVLDGRKGNDKLFGAEADDRLLGGKGKDLVVGSAGDDVLKGGAGQDTFFFSEGFGSDRIVDFKIGEDLIRFDTSIFSDFTELRDAMTGHKGGVLIDTGDDTLFLDKVKLSKLADHDFMFA